MPCLNEERVIGETVDRLLQFPAPLTRTLIIDDGSTDATAEIARAHGGERVWILRREPPDARNGKGDALNAGYRFLLNHGVVQRFGTENVILCVVDADGRLADNALAQVLPYFSNPDQGAVQVGVRMYNRDHGLIARLQDMEFVVFGDVFQKGRQSIGSVGLGGNGQFVRLAALQSLGDAPWTACLTEDLDLGVRLLTRGWKNAHCVDTYVEQQAVTTLRRLIWQRARWFQGHMQCMRLVPQVMRAVKLSVAASFDIVYHLTSPILVLLTSLVTIGFVASIGFLAVEDMLTAEAIVPSPEAMALAYVLSFGMAPIFAIIYRAREPSVSRWSAIGLAHLYAPYAALWLAAAWLGVGRAVLRRRRWTKTERDSDTVRGAVLKTS